MDFVKREDQNQISIVDDQYKAYLETLQKTHQMETEYQHTPMSMEQIHQLQSTLNSTIVQNFQLPLSPRQMSTLMLKTNHLTRNFNEVPLHLSRNLTDIDLQSLSHDLTQVCRPEDLILTQNLGRNLDLARNLSMDLELQNSLAQSLVQNVTEQELARNLSNDLIRINEVLPQNLSHDIDLTHHLNRANIEQEILNQNERRTPMVVSMQENLVDQSFSQRMEQNLGRLEQNLGQRLEQNLSQRLDQNLSQRLEQNLSQRLEQNLSQRLEQNLSQRMDQTLSQRLEHSLSQRLEQNISQRLEQNLSQRIEQNLAQRLVSPAMSLHEAQRPIEPSEHLLQMPFHIKSEQEDDGYFYENINQNISINGHLPAPAVTEHQPAAVHQDGQLYVYAHNNHNITIPALNQVDIYARSSDYVQNYISMRENPQNLVIHRQYDNDSPYPDEFKKFRQDGAEENGGKLKEQPKENMKPTDQNKIFYSEFNGQNSYQSTDKTDDSNESKLTISEDPSTIKGEYVCYKCNEVFPSKRGLKQHSKACTEIAENDTEKLGKFCCSQCSYRCQSLAILKIHERVHSGEKPFSCTFCSYKSGQKNNVAKHILVHMNQKPFRCKYCEYRCAQKNNLVVHERTHTGVKPFACPYCEYRTVQKPNLVKHMYLHTDQKPFSCDQCTYRCVQKTNLTKHKQRHLTDKDGDNVEIKNPIKPYRPRQKSVKCPLCPYKCVQKSSLEKHVQFKHPDQNAMLTDEHFDQTVQNDENEHYAQTVQNDENVEMIQNLSVRKDDVVKSNDKDVTLQS